jgi:ABC-type glycerol-3-phosphate transport system substrate-binding protein
VPRLPIGQRLAKAGLALTACALITAFASGCGSSSNPGTSGQKGVTNLTVWNFGSTSPKLFPSLAALFHKEHPNIVVHEITQPFNSYFTLAHAAIAAGKGPDIMQNYASPFLFGFQSGIESLQPYMTPTLRNELTGWPLVSTSLSASGTPYAVPWTSQGVQFYYNKALFAKAGLDPNKTPTTWAEFLADCKALKAAGIVPIVAGYKDGYYAEWFVDILASQFMSNAQLSQMQRQANWLDPAWAKGWQYMLELNKLGYMTPESPAINYYPDAVNNFGSGKGAMLVGLSGYTGNWYQFQSMPVGNNLGGFLPPVLPGSLYSTPRYNYAPLFSWTMMKWSKNKKAAAQFLEFMSSAPAQALAFKLAGSLPNNVNVTPSSSNSSARQILGWIHGGAPQYMGPDSCCIRANVEPVLDKMAPEVVSGQISVQAALQQVQQAQEQAPAIPSQ